MGKLYAISDIHGCFKTFSEMVVNGIKLKKSDRLILLGDYIDRGEQSKEVVDFILDLEKGGFDVTTLTGNHELMLTESYHDRNMLPLWLMNSGMTTLQSFGVDDVGDIEKKYIDFFLGLEYYKKIGDFIFVHAGFNDRAEDPFSDKFTMVWEAALSYSHPVFSGKTIIHGHRPKTLSHVKRLIDEKSNVIPVDTGCVYGREMGYGFLSALEVNTMKLISVPQSQ